MYDAETFERLVKLRLCCRARTFGIFVKFWLCDIAFSSLKFFVSCSLATFSTPSMSSERLLKSPAKMCFTSPPSWFHKFFFSSSSQVFLSSLIRTCSPPWWPGRWTQVTRIPCTFAVTNSPSLQVCFLTDGRLSRTNWGEKVKRWNVADYVAEIYFFVIGAVECRFYRWI